jgi:predicted dehydrogenase
MSQPLADDPVRVGLVGCGVISDIYLKNLGETPGVAVVACADLVPERAQEKAETYGVARSCTPEELLADPEIEVVLNLTIPNAHAAVARAAVAAGKSVYNEKPLTIDLEEGRRLIAEAETRGVLVGCAPDTFLGGGMQTCRALIDAGAIGEPVAANAWFLGHGHESWHPDPAFYYKAGGGPMFDMGPYYLTALVSLLGPVRRVTGQARISFPQRTITSKRKYGETIDVEVPTHVTGILEFGAGAIGTVATSFDVWTTEHARLEVFGAEGSLRLPDPNTFGGPVQILKAGSNEWEDVPLTRGHTENSRGLGVADLAAALRGGGQPRASGAQALHVLEIMHAIHTSAANGHHVELASPYGRPAPLPAN